MESRPKKVIFTALTGNHDALQQPAVVRADWDYICFTDSPLAEQSESVWQFRSIPFDGGKIEKARRMKILPHLYLPEYEYSVWMDANLCICGEEFYERMEALMQSGEKLAMIQHPTRDCVYEELCVCYRTHRISWKQAQHHLTTLFSFSMPAHKGLYETNVVFRQHNEPTIKALDEDWWALFANCSTRDQLTFTPALFRAEQEGRGLIPNLFLGQNSARNVDFIRYSSHNPGVGPKVYFVSRLLRTVCEKFLKLRIYLVTK